MNHTKEPWIINQMAEIEAGNSILGRVYCGDIFPNPDFPEGNANALRIIHCVNALAGVEDPGQFVQEAHDRILDEANFNKAADQAIKDTENAREYLISEGFDPDEIGKQGATFVRILSEKTKLEKKLSEMTNMMGVGDGSGKLFVHGNYESIKAAQLIVDQRDQAWKDDKEIRGIIDADDNESTVDEVRSLRLNYNRSKQLMQKVGVVLDRLTDILSPGDMVIHAELMRESKLPDVAKEFDEFADEFTELVNIVRPGE